MRCEELSCLGPAAVAVPLLDKRAGTGEFLDAVVLGVTDKDVSLAVDGDALGDVEFPRSVSPIPAAPGVEVLAIAGELLDPVVPGVGDVDVAGSVEGDAARTIEAAIQDAMTALLPVEHVRRQLRADTCDAGLSVVASASLAGAAAAIVRAAGLAGTG